MQTVIITGMSGAGKTSAIHVLEDIGYYCIDNIPPMLISSFITLCEGSNFNTNKIAFVADARSGELVTHLYTEIDKLRRGGKECTVLFLDADDETLIKRYKETRRKHPQGGNGRIADGIRFERELFSEIRKSADLVIDTSNLLTRELRERVVSYFESHTREYEPISVNVVSFGFKRGIPLDCDLVFDVRFMPNPFYDEELREKTGKTKEVADYALSCESSQQFLQKLTDMLLHLLPLYIEEGKNSLVVGIGCTGGKHRSVAVAEYLKNTISQQNYYVSVNHRDLGNE
ncbi:MAG: RNase adapter RapZ [Clostridia bacterium]|nr:RNase adapter RapZ [Clostridia bacterium]